jgi:putative transposase
MPNHIHLVCVFSNPAKVSDYMRDFKKFTFAEIQRRLIADGRNDFLEQFRIGENKYKIWKERFDDYAIRDVKSVQTKINYIHQNPVRKGLVTWPDEYFYSSASFYASKQQGEINITHFVEALGYQSTYGYGHLR